MTNKILEDPKINIKLILSALWITLMFLYLYADFLSLFTPNAIEEMIAGNMGPFPATQGALMSATIMMIIPSIMVFLSLTLKPKINRNTNIVMGVLYTIISIANIIGETWAYYITFGIIESFFTILIVRYAWKWPNSSKL